MLITVLNMRSMYLLMSMLASTLAWSPLNYAFDPRIHNFGNHGVMGKIHAKIAPIFTKMIDASIYDGKDVRQNIVKENGFNKTVLDMGCGTGFSTSDGFGCVGIDASEEMIEEAMRQFPGKIFEIGHAEYYEPEKEYDVVTCMFLMHEAPGFARRRIINNAKKIAKEKVIIVDICPEYKPSKLMKLGEPYVEDYLKNIRDDVKDFYEDIIIPGHVHYWILEKNDLSEREIMRFEPEY